MIRMWEQNTHYLVDDIVSNDGKVYRCELEHILTTLINLFSQLEYQRR